MKVFEGKVFHNHIQFGTLSTIATDGTEILIVSPPSLADIPRVVQARGIVITGDLDEHAHETYFLRDYCVPVIYDVNDRIREFVGENVTLYGQNGYGYILPGTVRNLHLDEERTLTSAFSSTISGMEYYHRRGARFIATRAEFMLYQVCKGEENIDQFIQNNLLTEKLRQELKRILSFGLSHFEELVFRFSDRVTKTDFSQPYTSKNCPNTSLSSRGTMRLLDSDLNLFKFQIKLVSEIFNTFSNLSLVLPYVRTYDEARIATTAIRESYEGRLGCMVEVPSLLKKAKNLNVIFDFFIIGCSDFFQLIEGKDRYIGQYSTDTIEFTSTVIREFFLKHIDKEKSVFVTSWDVFQSLNKDFENVLFLGKST